MPETNFFWDPLSDNILQERDETGAVTAEYTTEPGLYGNLISQNRQGVESQYHFDALGSTLALTDDNQQVTDSYAYSAFGEVTAPGITLNPFKYVGKHLYYDDDLTRGYWIRLRPYDPRHVRWISPDPVALLESANSYAYVSNQPTVLSDPSGEYAFPPILGIGIIVSPVGVVIGGTVVIVASAVCIRYAWRRASTTCMKGGVQCIKKASQVIAKAVSAECPPPFGFRRPSIRHRWECSRRIRNWYLNQCRWRVFWCIVRAFSSCGIFGQVVQPRLFRPHPAVLHCKDLCNDPCDDQGPPGNDGGEPPNVPPRRPGDPGRQPLPVEPGVTPASLLQLGWNTLDE